MRPIFLFLVISSNVFSLDLLRQFQSQSKNDVCFSLEEIRHENFGDFKNCLKEVFDQGNAYLKRFIKTDKEVSLRFCAVFEMSENCSDIASYDGVGTINIGRGLKWNLSSKGFDQSVYFMSAIVMHELGHHYFSFYKRSDRQEKWREYLYDLEKKIMKKKWIFLNRPVKKYMELVEVKGLGEIFSDTLVSFLTESEDIIAKSLRRVQNKPQNMIVFKSSDQSESCDELRDSSYIISFNNELFRDCLIYSRLKREDRVTQRSSVLDYNIDPHHLFGPSYRKIFNKFKESSLDQGQKIKKSLDLFGDFIEDHFEELKKNNIKMKYNIKEFKGKEKKIYEETKNLLFDFSKYLDLFFLDIPKKKESDELSV